MPLAHLIASSAAYRMKNASFRRKELGRAAQAFGYAFRGSIGPEYWEANCSRTASCRLVNARGKYLAAGAKASAATIAAANCLSNYCDL